VKISLGYGEPNSAGKIASNGPKDGLLSNLTVTYMQIFPKRNFFFSFNQYFAFESSIISYQLHLVHLCYSRAGNSNSNLKYKLLYLSQSRKLGSPRWAIGGYYCSNNGFGASEKRCRELDLSLGTATFSTNTLPIKVNHQSNEFNDGRNTADQQARIETPTVMIRVRIPKSLYGTTNCMLQ